METVLVDHAFKVAMESATAHQDSRGKDPSISVLHSCAS
jgi:hypothetical protein